MNEILKEDLKEVRVISKSNLLGKEIDVYGDATNPLFLAKDVADWIGHSDVSTMIRVVDEDEKMSLTNPNNLCGGQKSWFLTENGLYEVLMQSRKPIAKLFKKGVKKILHEIRTKGGYIAAKRDDTPEMIMARAVLVAQETMKKQKQQLEQANERIALQDAQLKQQAPKVKYVDNVLQSVNTYTTTQMSKELGLREAKQLYNNLKEHGYMFKQSGQWLLTAKYSEKGYTKSRTYQFTRNDGSIGTSSTTVWTEKGRHWLHELQSSNKI